MKKILSLALILVLTLGCFSGCQLQDNRTVINVYNWGQYISDGSDGYMDVIAEFERRNPDIRVNYVTFDSNETMYTKMANGGITVDVIIPSDYMVGRLIEDNMLLPLNFDNIPNFQNIDPQFLGKNFDPENTYSVPYAWGVVGIIYNTKYVAEEDVVGWDLLWNEKYAGKILMFDNSRDAFCIAQCRNDFDINDPDPQKLLKCAQDLAAQRPVVQQYIMDQVFDLMENEEAWIAPYYAGDYLTMAEENENLNFYLPEDEGFNLFVDAMCIPTCCENKEAAERFINFLCDPEIAGSNMDWVCYGSPLHPESGVQEWMDPEVYAFLNAYPLEKGMVYESLPRNSTRLMEELFMQVRNGIPIHLPD